MYGIQKTVLVYKVVIMDAVNQDTFNHGKETKAKIQGKYKRLVSDKLTEFRHSSCDQGYVQR